MPHEDFEDVYPATRSVIGPHAWERLIAACDRTQGPEALGQALTEPSENRILPDFLPELVALEWTRHQVASSDVDFPDNLNEPVINPTLEVLPHEWQVSALLNGTDDLPASVPRHEAEWALVWRGPKKGETHVQAATDNDLLVMKLLCEEIDPAEAAATAGISLSLIETAFQEAARKGLILGLRSRIRRDPADFAWLPDTPEKFLSAGAFTIQWHITHACDLHCKHCYDRSKRSALTLKQGRAMLDNMRAFCEDRRVRGHVCFTGGNPFLYPNLLELYRAAMDCGFSTSILGNPVSRRQLEAVLDIRKPNYYQVSLEGLPEHNDNIRGAGHFFKVIEFLGVLRDLGISSAVMLTLTRDNMDQVLPLAERLRGHADHFTFNRLSPVGEGANLHLPTPEAYAAFLEEYVDAARENPIIGYKDNLINIVRHRRGLPVFDGCTGFGCGAAFNFLAVLPDGEAHACRKFPSPLGNVLEQGIAAVYDSNAARRYRRGSRACRSCVIRPVCGGCLSVAHGCGCDIFEDRDPFCFIGAQDT